MSFNVTIHERPQPLFGKYICDPQRIKKEIFDYKRKQRLEQVRLKSKQLANQIRKNINTASQKQLERIEQIKNDELRKWREKVLTEKQHEYEVNLHNLGDAHKAAALEIQDNSKRTQHKNLPTNLQNHSQKKIFSKEINFKPKVAKNLYLNSLQRQKDVCKSKKITPVETEVKQKRSYADFKNRSKIEKHSKSKKSYHIEKEQTATINNKEIFDSAGTVLLLDSDSEKTKSVGQNFVDSDNDDIISTISSSGNHYQQSHFTSNFKSQSYSASNISLQDESANATSQGKVKNSSRDYRPFENKYTDTSSQAYENVPISQKFTLISDLIKNRQTNTENKYLPYNLDDTLVPKSVESNKPNLSARESFYKTSILTTGSMFNTIDKETQTFNDLDTHEKSNKQTTTKSIIQSETASIPSKRSPSRKSSKIASSLNKANRVQFYDYKNKFQKTYTPQKTVVEKNNEAPHTMNANELAEIELKNMSLKEGENEEKRKRCEVRCQRAIERENVRRDYNALTNKLEALTKEKEALFEGLNDAYLYAEHRLHKLETQKQTKLNAAIENILNQPVLITCPEVQKEDLNQIHLPSNLNSQGINVGNEKHFGIRHNDATSLNSSDSCTSILLNYVDKQSEQVTKDICSCHCKNKVNKLKNLLKRINELRLKLIKELKTFEEADDNINIEDAVKSIYNLRKERENILSENEAIKQTTELEKREKELMERESIFEKKLKEFYKEKKKINIDENLRKESMNDVIVSTDEKEIVISPEILKATKPVQIIIQIPEKLPQSPSKNLKQSTTLVDNKVLQTKPLEKNLKIVSKNKVDIKESIPKLTKDIRESIPKLAKSTKEPDEYIENIEAKSRTQATQILESTSSTSYFSLPNLIRNKLSDALDIKVVENTKTLKNSEIDTNKKINPTLARYITRLLGMSRKSIEMLGVSNSEVETPSSSVINTSANFSIPEIDKNKTEQIERLQKFINDNYSFLSEIEDSLKTDESDKTIEESVKDKVTQVWNETLKKSDKKIKTPKESVKLKSILKSSKNHKKNVENKKTGSDDQLIEATQTLKPFPKEIIKSPTEESYNELSNKYSELTDNCNQRIERLSQMINKVRMEKQKILDISLSSGTETEKHTMQSKEQDNHQSISSEDSKKTCQVEALDPIINLEKNKIIGISRDSGISLSRPITALDGYDASESQRVEEIKTTTDEFEPILKDITKIMTPLRELSTPELVTHIDSNEKDTKSKPPVSITRYSPLLTEKPPHELSTIVEIDTPVVSKLNTSIQEKDPFELSNQIDTTKLQFKKFMSFEEYAKLHNFDITKIDTENSLKLKINYEDYLIQTIGEDDLQYKEFPSMNTYLKSKNGKEISKSLESLESSDLQYKKFPTHKEYAAAMGEIGLLDTKSIEAISITDDKIKDDDLISEESILDIAAELKKRNLLQNSFRNAETGNGINTLDGNEKKKTIEFKGKSTSLSEFLEINTGHSKSKNPIANDITGIELLPSSSDGIENDLNKMGLKWASLMLRKTQQVQDISTSTSSNFSHPQRKKPLTKSNSKEDPNVKLETKVKDELESIDYSITPETGRVLNLREFLLKELQKRTNSSLSSGDESLTGQFLRSLLASSSSSQKTCNNRNINQEQHKTSTPLQGYKLNSNNNLFSFESQISSVRNSSLNDKCEDNALFSSDIKQDNHTGSDDPKKTS